MTMNGHGVIANHRVKGKKHPVCTGCFEVYRPLLGGLTRVAQALGDAVDGGMHHGQQLRVLRRLFQVL